MTAARNIFKALINHWLIMHIIFLIFTLKSKLGICKGVRQVSQSHAKKIKHEHEVESIRHFTPS